mgnify:CR=1 FL=1
MEDMLSENSAFFRTIRKFRKKVPYFLHNSKVKYLNHNNDNMDKPGDISPTEKIKHVQGTGMEAVVSYTTQMDAARQGIVTPEMEIVAAKENMGVEKLRELIAKGQVIIPANRIYQALSPNGIGSALKTKINVNLGTSRDCVDLDMEMEKVNEAVAMGAEAIMDLSSFGDTQKFRRKLTAECPATIGTVPIYDAVVYYHKPLKDITTEEWLSNC